MATIFPPQIDDRRGVMSKVLLVTGGSRGIGAATAIQAARHGYDVAISYRQDRLKAQKVVAEIEKLGQRAIAIEANVQDPTAIIRLFEAVDQAFGRLDALVNSAGIGHITRIEDTEPQALHSLFATNVFGSILASREAIKRLSTRHGGRGGAIINISSMAATIGGRPGAALYAASKAAIDAFTTGLAKEVAPEGIRAISVRPGFTHTDMTEASAADPEVAAAITATIPLGRAAEADEIARPVVWLLSADASFISGAHLDISGGGFLVGGRFLSYSSATDSIATDDTTPSLSTSTLIA